MTEHTDNAYVMPDRAQEMKWAIADSDKPVLTVDDLADEIDVSRQTIHQHKDELEDDVAIKIDSVGQATVFYHRAAEGVDKQSHEGSWREHLYGRRAMWLGTVEDVKTRRRLEGETLGQRIDLWKAFERHPYKSTEAYEPALETRKQHEELEEQSDADQEVPYPDFYKFEERVSIPPVADISEDEVRMYDEEVYLFESDWFGEVTGLGGLNRFRHKMRSRLADEHFDDVGDQIQEAHSVRLDEFDDDLLDELLPTVSQIIAGGDAADHLFCGLLGVSWG